MIKIIKWHVSKNTIIVGLALFLPWLLFFSRIIVGGQIFFLDDLKIIYYPLEHEYAETLQDWRLPLWSNTFGFGHPLIAWGQLGFFTPIHLLLRLMQIHPLWLLQLSIMSYFLVGLIGMFVFLRSLKINQAAAVLGAVLFIFCGFTVGHLNHVNFYTSTMLLPWLLLAINKLLEHQRPTRIGILALVAAAITLSGQPQIVLYTFFIAALVTVAFIVEQLYAIRSTKESWRWLTRVTVSAVVSVILGLMVSSFAILPLYEFIAESDRAAALPMEELFEFSYLPSHAVTLLLPYFFGDHEYYWGAKGFQELAAFTGIIPLLLAGSALWSWKHLRGLRIAGILLVVSGIFLATGIHSPIYVWLVENHYLTSIGVAGRFVYFFDIGIIFLASLGLHDIASRLKLPRIEYRLAMLAGSLSLPLVLLAPFFIRLFEDEVIGNRLYELSSRFNVSFLMIILGLLATSFSIVMIGGGRGKKIVWALPILSAATLLVYAWDYNPMTARDEAFTQSEIIQELVDYSNAHSMPARLYSRPNLSLITPPGKEQLSEPISPKFTVYQPLLGITEGIQCVAIPIFVNSSAYTSMDVMIREGFSGKILTQGTVSSKEVDSKNGKRFCLPAPQEKFSEAPIASFSSSEETNMRLYISPAITSAERSYFVRVVQPSLQELNVSKKEFSVQYFPQYLHEPDLEYALLARHLNVIANTSSAQWIGALSIGSYRDFIDTFFANDNNPTDGDGIHAIVRFKNIFDMAGITHLAQALRYDQQEDSVLNHGYTVAAQTDSGTQILRLYENKDAYPKAFLVSNGDFVPAADEARTAMRLDSFNPRLQAYISGPTPPNSLPSGRAEPAAGVANVVRYENGRVDVEVETDQENILVVNDSTTPEWQTYIDGKPALQLVANTVFKAALVPAGKHVVSFRYESPAILKAKWLTISSIMVIAALFVVQSRGRRSARGTESE